MTSCIILFTNLIKRLLLNDLRLLKPHIKASLDNVNIDLSNCRFRLGDNLTPLEHSRYYWVCIIEEGVLDLSDTIHFKGKHEACQQICIVHINKFNNGWIHLIAGSDFFSWKLSSFILDKLKINTLWLRLYLDSFMQEIFI